MLFRHFDVIRHFSRLLYADVTPLFFTIFAIIAAFSFRHYFRFFIICMPMPAPLARRCRYAARRLMPPYAYALRADIFRCRKMRAARCLFERHYASACAMIICAAQRTMPRDCCFDASGALTRATPKMPQRCFDAAAPPDSALFFLLSFHFRHYRHCRLADIIIFIIFDFHYFHIFSPFHIFFTLYYC